MLNRLFGYLPWLGMALVLVALAISGRPDLLQWRRGSALFGLILILLYGAGHWRSIVRSFDRKQTRYGALAGTSLILVIAIVAGLNYIFARQNRRWDLTSAQQYSLSDQTQQILDNLSAPVRILVFAREPEFPRYQDRLDEYAYQSNQVTVDYIDADREPLLARQYEIQTYGTIVFEYEDRVERVESDSEQDLTNTLIKVVEGTEQTVYFIEGHGEKSHTGSGRDGYSTISAALGLDNFGVASLILAQQLRVPEDATVVVVAGPQTDLLPGELEALRTYLNRGGKLLVLIDPPTAGETATPDGLFALVREWGINVGTDVVVDASGVGQLFGADASVPVAANYPSHPITDRFNLLTAYPLARSVTADSGSGSPDGRVAQPFIQTSAQSWAEADLAGLATGQVELNEEVGDRPGPITIGMAVSVPAATSETETAEIENPNGQATDAEEDAAPQPPETRLAVIGDSDFASNATVGIQGNQDMFLNTVNWLAQQENLISIRAREPEDRRLSLTAAQQQRVFWFSLLLLPAFLLGAGINTWWRRR